MKNPEFYDSIKFMKKFMLIRNLVLLFITISQLTGCGYYALQVPYPDKIYTGTPTNLVLNIRTSTNLERISDKKALPASPDAFNIAAQDYFTTYFTNTKLFGEVVTESSGDIDLQIVIVYIRNDIKGFEELRSMPTTFNTQIDAKYYVINKLHPEMSSNGTLKGTGYVKLGGPADINDYQNAHSQALSNIAKELYPVLLNSISQLSSENR